MTKVPRLTDKIIEIGPNYPVRSFSRKHLLHGTRLLPLDLLLKEAEMYRNEQYGVVAAGIERLHRNSGREAEDKLLIIRLIAHGQGYGLAGQVRIARVLWQMAVHLMDKHGVEHVNDLITR